MAYHDRTKHHPERYADGPGGLDWATQPNPFRRFRGAPVLRLPLAGPDKTPAATFPGCFTWKPPPGVDWNSGDSLLLKQHALWTYTG